MTSLSHRVCLVERLFVLLVTTSSICSAWTSPPLRSRGVSTCSPFLSGRRQTLGRASLVGNRKSKREDSDRTFEEQFRALVDPVQQALDDTTGGWALSYADLTPDDESTPLGRAFLATNLAYAVVGLLLAVQGNIAFGILIDVTALASFNYHYNQLLQRGQAKSPDVRLALLIDYFFAGISILTALFYLFTSNSLPTEALSFGALGLVFLGLCWIYERGTPYMLLHGAWHLFSAYAGYLLGTEHH